MATPEELLAGLGLELPAPFPPAADYVACRRSGNLLFVSGHGPMREGRIVYSGRLQTGADVAIGQASAELTMLNVLASMKAELGELSRVRAFLRLSVFVNCSADFTAHPAVADGASTLLGKLFGPGAAHSRYAVGMISLPFGITTEIEAVAEID